MLWSPDDGVILAQKIDARGIPCYPVVTFYTDQNLQLPNEQVDLSKRLPRAGERLPTPELVLIDTASGQLKHVALTEARDATIRFLAWPRESTEAFVLVTTRAAKRMAILGINGRTGVSREIPADTSETFLMTPQGRYEFLFTSFSDGKRFLWGSERDGWRHLYLYRTDGKLLRRLTRGEFPVLRIVAVDEQQGWVYLTAHGEPRLYDTHLYRVDLEGKQVRRLTEGEGTHNVTFSPDRRYFVDNWSSVSSPPIAELRTADGRLLQVLSRASLDYARRAGWRAPEEFVVKAADGRTDLYGVLYKPWNLIPTRKYPVIDMIYAGPLLTWVPHTFLGEPRSSNPVQARALAQLGFIVMIVDARGTPERSKAFQDAVYGNIGRYEIPDHVLALQQLAAQRPYMDVARVGVIGHSWGGYFALRAMFIAPDLFKVGIAQAPVVDLWLEAPDIEPYMGLPQRNRNSYEYASNLWLADRLKGKLLLVHGTSDAGAPLSGTMRLLAALAKAGKPYDLVLLVHGRHNDAATSAYSRERAEQYLVENLRSTP